MNRVTERVERVGCAHWTSSGKLELADRTDFPKPVETSQRGRKFALVDVLRIQAALRGEEYWPLPLPRSQSIALNVPFLMGVARDAVVEIIPTRGLRGRKDEVQKEFSKIIDDGKTVHARVTSFMDLEP